MSSPVLGCLELIWRETAAGRDPPDSIELTVSGNRYIG